MIDRLGLLAAVNMLAPPSTQGVAKRLAISRDEAEIALTQAERVQLVAKEPRERPTPSASGKNRHLWRLSDEGRAEMYRLLHVH